MTGNRWGHGGPGGPPWSVDLLADLHADVLDPEAAAELRRGVSSDLEAKAILEALDATRADLRALAEVPVQPMPAEFAARLDAALEAEVRAAVQQPPIAPSGDASGGAKVIDLAAARRRRNRIVAWGSGLLATAAAAVAVFVATTPTTPSTPGTTGQAMPAPGVGSAAPLEFSSNDLGDQQLDAAKGGNDYGPFADKQKRAACFDANGISPTAEPIGARQVRVDGKPGTLFVLAHGLQFRLVVVDATCGPGSQGKLADKIVGGLQPTR